MKRFLSVTLCMVLLTVFSAASASPAAAREQKILEFDTMVGTPAGLTGTQSLAPLRGVPGGGLPWVLTSAHGELRKNGKLDLKVQGLVLAGGPNAGSNPSPVFRALVSCLGSDGSVQNVLSDPFPATTGPAASGGGNARIEASLMLPQPCIAPIVFVTSNTGSWFAVTGN